MGRGLAAVNLEILASFCFTVLVMMVVVMLNSLHVICALNMEGL